MKTTKILLILLLFTLFAQAAADRSIYRKKYGKENKVALVIGNSHYAHFSPLKNTLNDASDMRKILKSKGFDVLYLKDGDLRSMKKIVRKFSHKLKQGGVGFFYYAGHGLEVNGKNYLIPVDTEASEEDEIEFESLPVDLIISKMENSHNRLNIIVLDACRNNPFSRGGGGLAQINNAKGMYIAFATAPGKVASDGGGGRNGLFTKNLIKYIEQPGLSLNDVFDKTRASVNEESNGAQWPWTSSSIIGSFYFQPDTSSPAPYSPLSDQSAEKAELQRLRELKQQREAAEREELERLREEEKRYREQREAESGITRGQIRSLIDRYIVVGNNRDIDGMINLYAQRVDYFRAGNVSRSFVYKDKRNYYKRWPSLHVDLIGIDSIDNVPGRRDEKIVTYRIYFDVYNYAKQKGIKGRARNTVILKKENGGLKIISDKQKVLERRKYR